MTNARRFISLATAALVLVALGACSQSGDPAASGTPTPSSSAPSSPTQSASPKVTTSGEPTDAEVASRAASAALRRYYEVRNQLRRDMSLPIRRLNSVAISTELATEKNLFKTERSQGLHQTGATKLAMVQVRSVNLDNSDPKAGKVPTVQIDVCYDVSDVDIVNAHGKSAVSPSRPDTGWIEYLVSNYQWNVDPYRGWRVASSQDLKRTPCAAS